MPDGRSFLEACAATLFGAGAAPVVATLPPATADPGIGGLQVVALPERGLDMFASIRHGLDALLAAPDWERVALLPVDHPLVASVTVSVLAAAGGRASIPCCGGKHGHPVVLDRVLARGIADGRHRGPTLREVLRGAGATDVAVDDRGTIANCNTPEVLERAISAG